MEITGERITLHPSEQADEKAYLRQEYVRSCAFCSQPLADLNVAFLRVVVRGEVNPSTGQPRHEDYAIHETCPGLIPAFAL